MCTVTLSYDDTNIMAQQQLAALLATGLFMQLPVKEEEPFPGLDYNNPNLWKEDDDLPPLPQGKESYTLEEFREILINDIHKIYEMKDEVCA